MIPIIYKRNIQHYSGGGRGVVDRYLTKKLRVIVKTPLIPLSTTSIVSRSGIYTALRFGNGHISPAAFLTWVLDLSLSLSLK